MLIDCPGCGKTNRVDVKKRSRCANCKRDFGPRDLVKARPEPRPSFALDVEDDIEQEEDETCGDCGGRLDEDGMCPRCDD